MTRTSDAEWREFVMTGTRTGKLAGTRLDGRPHVTPVWFMLDGDDVVMTTHETSAKARALRREPRAALCVDDQQPPYSFVMLECTAAMSDDLDELSPVGDGDRRRLYGGPAEEFGARNGVPGELLVRLRITNVA